MRRILSIVLLGIGLLCTNASSSFAQDARKSANSEKVFTSTELQADFKVLQGALEESHAGLYWFISKPNLDRKFKTIYASLNQGLTQRQFYARLLPLVAGLRHGHTSISDSTQGVGYALRELNSERKFLPLDLQFVGEKIYVRHNCSSNPELKAGSEILSINRKPVSEIVARMMEYVSADGTNATFKRYQLEKFKFHVLLDLLYGHKQELLIESRPPDSERISSSTIPTEFPHIIARNYQKMVGRSIDFFPAAFQFEILNESRSAVLTVRSFYEGYGEPQKRSFERFLDETFTELKNKKIKNLILDLRNNEGGNDDYVPLLYSFLTDKPFNLGNPTVLASNRSFFFSYADQLSEELKQFQAAPDSFVSLSQTGEYVLNKKVDFEQYAVYQPRSNNYKNRLYILTSGGSFSATNKFIDLAYYYRDKNRRTVFVGEQNGGDTGYGRSTGGQSLRIILPNSKLKVNIPLLGFTQLNRDARFKVKIPDYEVKPSQKDVAEGIDRVLEFAKHMSRMGGSSTK